jgi:hypothetical protein
MSSTQPLNPPRGPLADRVAIQQQRHHHRRLVRRPAVAIVAIGRVERRQIHRLDRLDHEPRQVILGQPLPQRRRQQQLLVAITAKEVLRHPKMVLTPPDDTPITQQPPWIATARPESRVCREPADSPRFVRCSHSSIPERARRRVGWAIDCSFAIRSLALRSVWLSERAVKRERAERRACCDAVRPGRLAALGRS